MTSNLCQVLTHCNLSENSYETPSFIINLIALLWVQKNVGFTVDNPNELKSPSIAQVAYVCGECHGFCKKKKLNCLSY